MAQLTPAAEAIAALRLQGWNYSQIGKALGVNPSLVRQAINPSPGQKQKPLTKYVPALQGLQGKKPGAAPTTALPAKRTTKSGKVAGVRKGVQEFKTKKGQQHVAARVKKGPKTLRRAIERAAKQGKNLKWDVQFKRMVTKSDTELENAWATGKLPDGWDAQTLLDRIDNPQAGDNWRAGDVNAALIDILKEQNIGESLTRVSGAEDFSLFTVD